MISLSYLFIYFGDRCGLISDFLILKKKNREPVFKSVIYSISVDYEFLPPSTSITNQIRVPDPSAIRIQSEHLNSRL